MPYQAILTRRYERTDAQPSVAADGPPASYRCELHRGPPQNSTLDASRYWPMAQQALAPTDHPEINSVLQELLSGARGILGDQFVGMYLDGSRAIGDFEPDKSDLDFVVVTASEVSSASFEVLKTMHDHIAAGTSKWARELEGSYISRRALRHGRRPAAHPYIDRGSVLVMVQQESGYWTIHRHMLREHGVVLAGPPPKMLIDPVRPEELQEAVRGILREWWMPMLVTASARQAVDASHPTRARVVPSGAARPSGDACLYPAHV